MLLRPILFAVILAVMASVAACSRVPKAVSAPDAPRRITVSIEPQRAIAEAIGGDRVVVSSLLRGGADPETFDPTIASLVSLERSDAYIKLGRMPFEDALLSRLGSAAPRVFDASRGVTLIEGTHGHDHHHDHDGDDEDDADHHGHNHDLDPHYWSSLPNIRIMAANIAAALCDIDPDGADYYSRRLDSLTAYVDSLDRCFAATLAPVRGSSFLVWHPSLSYFARDYGLHQIAVGSDNKEATVAMLHSVIDRARDCNTDLYFSQPGYNDRLSATLRGSVDARCVEINVLDYDWASQLSRAVDALAHSSSPASPK